MNGDIVIDTNVLVHANNPEVPRQGDSINFIENLLASELEICVDEGFNIIESNNRSHIGHEYHTHLVFGMLGFAFLAQMAQSNRIKIISKKVNQKIDKMLKQRISNNGDKVFVKITINSSKKILISHDFDDFPKNIRSFLKDSFDIEVLTASEY